MKDVLKEQRLIKTTDLRANKGQLVDRGIPTNPRKITKEKFNLLLQSLDKSNLTQIRPLDVIEHEDKFIVLSRNQRLRALKELKIKEVPCNILRDDLEPETYRQIVLQANTNYGEHDDDLLANEWDAGELHEWGYDLPDWETEKIEEETEGDDDVPESAPAITVKGDLYTLGEHRLLCGNSTMIDDVKKLMDGKKADMVFTSPPYNANAKTGDGDIFGGKKSKNMYEGAFVDNQSSDDYIQFSKDVLEICFQNTDGFIFWNVSYNAKSKFEYIAQIQDRLEYLIEQVCWKKSSTIPFKGMLMREWEPVYIFSTNKQGLKTKQVTSNFWQISNTDSQGENHKACFPVALPEKGISLVNKNTDIVFEPFCGSGSTLIACEKTKRKCYGMELDEKYCDVIVKRYIEFCVKNNKEAKVYRNGELINNDVFLVG